MRVQFAVLVVALVAIVAVVAVEGWAPELRSPPAEPVPAVTDGGRLVRLDPLSLRPVDRNRVRVGEPQGWARSPDGSRLAIVTDRGRKVRFVDLDHMRSLYALASRAQGSVAAVSWPRRDRVWIVLARPGCCATGSTTVIVADPLLRRVVARRHFAAGLARVAATREGVVLLLAPPATLGPAEFATVDAAGRGRTMPLQGVSAGLLPAEGVPFVLHTRQPGLTVDPRRHRAYVLPARRDAVEVDLRRGEIRRHDLSPHRSLLERIGDLLEPPAQAQEVIGPSRTARWLAPGLIALSGRDSRASWRASGAIEQIVSPAGLQLIDTDSWQVRTIDERVSAFHAAGGLLLADRAGLTAYRLDGREAFSVLEDRRVRLAGSAGALAYVRDGGRHHVVDLDAGRVVATSAGVGARLLLDPAPSPWD